MRDVLEALADEVVGAAACSASFGSRSARWTTPGSGTSVSLANHLFDRLAQRLVGLRERLGHLPVGVGDLAPHRAQPSPVVLVFDLLGDLLAVDDSRHATLDGTASSDRHRGGAHNKATALHGGVDANAEGVGRKNSRVPDHPYALGSRRVRRLLPTVLALACAKPSSPAAAPAEPAPEEPAAAPVVDTTDPRVDDLMRLVANPDSDKDGQARVQLTAALRDSTDPRAVQALVTVLGVPQERQPAAVHRQAVTSLGALRAADAVDDILVAIFSIPDAPTTTNIAERAKVALASIGAPAVPSLVAMLRGEHEKINAQAESIGIPVPYVKMTAAQMLAALDAPGAGDALLEALEALPCDDSEFMERAFLARAVGRIGHAPAASNLCRCLKKDANPGTAFPAAEALASIGGETATQCLVDTITSARWDADLVASKEFEHELRWEAVRLAALAGGAKAVPAIRKALAGNPKHVRERAKRFNPMLAALELCNDNATCLDEVIAELNANPFSREAAAHARARPESKSADLALAISNMFSARDPDVRVSAAVLTRRLAPRAGCPQCTASFRRVLKAEHGTMDARMQLSVIEARITIATVGDDATHVPFDVPERQLTQAKRTLFAVEDVLEGLSRGCAADPCLDQLRIALLGNPRHRLVRNVDAAGPQNKQERLRRADDATLFTPLLHALFLAAGEVLLGEVALVLILAGSHQLLHPLQYGGRQGRLQYISQPPVVVGVPRRQGLQCFQRLLRAARLFDVGECRQHAQDRRTSHLDRFQIRQGARPQHDGTQGVAGPDLDRARGPSLDLARRGDDDEDDRARVATVGGGRVLRPHAALHVYG